MNKFLPPGHGQDLLERLDQLERDMPRSIFVSAGLLARERDDSRLFKNLWATCELLARHLCELLNIDYVTGGVPDAAVEKLLRQLAAKQRQPKDSQAAFAYGDYVGALGVFLRARSERPAEHRRIPLLDSLGPVPPSCWRSAQAAELIKGPVVKIGTGPSYVHLKEALRILGSGPPPEKNLAGFLASVGNLRNQDAHLRNLGGGGGGDALAAADNDHSLDWCRAINDFLAPAVRELLLSDAIRNCLTRLQLVEVCGIDGGDGIEVRRMDAVKPPPRLYLRVAAGERPAVGERYLGFLAQPDAARYELTAVAKVGTAPAFPTSLREVERRVAEFQREFGKRLFDDGLLDDQERSWLGGAGILADTDIQPAVNGVWEQFGRVLRWAMDPDASVLSLDAVRAWLPQDKATDEVAALDHLRGFPMRVADVVRAALREHVWLTTAGIVEVTKLPPHVVDAAIGYLKDHRQGPGIVESGGGGVVRWRLPITEKAARIASEIEVVRARHSAERPPPDYVWDILETAIELLDQVAPGDDAVEQLRSALEHARNVVAPEIEASVAEPATAVAAEATESGPASPAPASGRPALTLEVDGRTFQARGLTGLIRALDKADVFHQRADVLVHNVRRKVGTSRFLVNTVAQHDKGTDFGYPVEVDLGPAGILYFEANFPGPVGVFHLGRWLSDCGYAVKDAVAEVAEIEAAEDAVPTASPATAEVTAMAPLADSPKAESTTAFPLWVSLHDPDSGVTTDVRGSRVKEFLREFFAHIGEMAAQPDQQTRFASLVPFKLRRRHLVAFEPIHSDGSPFRAAISLDTGSLGKLYVETHLSYDGALSAVIAFCEAARIECQAREETSGEEGLVDDAEAAAAADLDTGELSLDRQDGPAISGKTVKEFFRAALTRCADNGWLDHLPLPYAVPVGTSRRHLLDKDGKHASGAAFRNGMEFAWSGGILQVETNFGRPLARQLAATLLGELERRAALALPQAASETLQAE